MLAGKWSQLCCCCFPNVEAALGIEAHPDRTVQLEVIRALQVLILIPFESLLLPGKYEQRGLTTGQSFELSSQTLEDSSRV